MYLNQCVEHMKGNRWILLQISNHSLAYYNFIEYWLLKIYDQRRQLDILLKDAMISRNIAFERSSD